MSHIKTIEKEINRFLSCRTPEVLAIKGEWGVGKTFTWNRFIGQACKDEIIALKKYSYVSLFGINSLDTLKQTIFECTIETKHIGKEHDNTDIVGQLNKIMDSKGRSLANLAKKIPYLNNASSALESVFNFFINKTIICIDDVERKGNNLNIKDIMGLSSILKEQKGCKIVFILNNDSFSETDEKEFRKYNEKVIDIELLFEPTSSECVEIALPEDDNVSTELKENCKLLEIKNIRIIKKIERLALLLREQLSIYEDEILNNALKSLVLFSWCYYGIENKEQKPPITWIKNLNVTYDIEKEEEDVQDNYKNWRSLLNKYKYGYTEKFDLIIFEIVETGYIDTDKLHEEALRKNNISIASKSKISIQEAWNLFLNSFKNNEDEFIQNIFDSYKNNIKYINSVDLNNAVYILQEFNQNEKAEEIISLYINEHKNDPDTFCLKSYESIHVTNKTIIERFDKIMNSLKPKNTLSETLDFIIQAHGWNKEDIEILSKSTEDDFYNLFKNADGPYLADWIREVLYFGNITNSNPEYLNIYEKAKQSLIRISNESKINKKRVKRYIKIED